MLSRVVGLSASGLLGLRPRSVLKTGLWLQNGPWRSSILESNRQAAISTNTKRGIFIVYLDVKFSRIKKTILAIFNQNRFLYQTSHGPDQTQNKATGQSVAQMLITTSQAYGRAGLT